MAYFFDVRNDSIMVSEQSMLFSPFELKLFFGVFFTPPEQRNYQKVKYPWFCHSVTVSNMSSFLCLNTFQSAPNFVQTFLIAIPWYIFFRFLRFLLTFFSFFGGDLANFLRWNEDYFQVEFLWFLWCKWSILRLVYYLVCCAKMCFFYRFCTYFRFLGLCHILEVKSRPQPNRFFFLWCEWFILRLFC